MALKIYRAVYKYEYHGCNIPKIIFGDWVQEDCMEAERERLSYNGSYLLGWEEKSIEEDEPPE